MKNITEYIEDFRSKLCSVPQWANRTIEETRTTRRGDFLVLFKDGGIGWLRAVSSGGVLSVQDATETHGDLIYSLDDVNNALDLYDRRELRRAFVEYERERNLQRQEMRRAESIRSLSLSTGIPLEDIEEFVRHYSPTSKI